MKISLKIVVLVLINGLFFNSVKAKNNKLDSLVYETKLMVYIQPLEVIKAGDSLYNNETSTKEEKINGLLLISDALISVRNYSQAIEYINTAKELNPESNADLYAKIYSRFGYLYFQLNLYDEALKYLDRAATKNKSVTRENDFYVNAGYINTVRGMIYTGIFDCEMGMRYFEKAEKLYHKSSLDISRLNLSVVHYNKGNCFLTMEEYEKADDSFKKAYRAASMTDENKNSLKLFAEKGSANILMEQEKYAEAIEILEDLYGDARKIDDKSLLRSITSDLASGFLAIEDWESYKKYAKKNKNFDDEIMNFKKEAALISLEINDKSQTITIDQERKKIRKQLVLIVLIFIISIGLLLPIIVRIRMKIKKEQASIFKK